MKTLPLSVFIIAKNEADRITHTLESVQGWVDEVVVIDSGSTDDTVAVAKRYGARVVHRDWEGYGPQKVYGETLCQNTWLLNIDADEAIGPELKEEIQALFAEGEPLATAYALKIAHVFRFEQTPRRFAVATWQTRLYRRDVARFKPDLVHDSVVVDAGVPVVRLKGLVHHRCFRSHEHAAAKMNFYSSQQAEDMFAKGRNPSAWRILLEPPLAFLKAYFLRGYVMYGVEGVIQSYFYAFARFIRLAKAREKFQEVPRG